MNLNDLLANDPNLLKSINDAISVNPSQQHTLQILPNESKSTKSRAEKNVLLEELQFQQQSTSKKTGTF